MVGFEGSRKLSPQYQPLVTAVVNHFTVQGYKVATGCAPGADLFVRSAAPGAQVFYAASYSGPPKAQLTKRSISLVKSVAVSHSPLMVGFVISACPAGLHPSCNSGHCFAGYGSGSWASLALAAGLSVPVIVFWCAPGAPVLPSSWGNWQPAVGALGPLGGFQLCPAQPGLF